MDKKRYYILEKIIDRYENSKNDWRGEISENRSFPIQQSDFDACGRSELLEEARELEQLGLIKVKWFGGHSDIDRVTYHLERLPKIYELTGRSPKRMQVEADRLLVECYANEAETEWLRSYYEDLIGQLEKGKTPQDLKKYGPLLFRCLNALEKLREPVFVRIFSSQYLSDSGHRGSKVFQSKLKPRVVSITKKYHHPMVDDSMEDYQVLEQLYLTDYAQELAVKGELRIELNGQEINLAQFPYGTVLNTETLKHARICGKQDIKKVISVENKANFVSMAYEPGTLIVFSHGFFSPLEREFLKKLERVLESTVRYYHTGDLDYGGIRIFQHIRRYIFPKLEPYQMDAEQFDRYLEYASDIEDSAWEKLCQVSEPLLQPLTDRILETRKVIEQEAFLVKV
ncbi:MAG: DUF2399 domain-containing protein [Clostridium sp.]|nr:DUF2399 domain-containing protein [Clostridium sp.]